MMIRNIHKAIIALLLIGLPSVSFAKRYDVTLPEVASCLKTAQPGDQIYIKDGQYKDMQLKWIGKGTEKSPITIEALNPGKVKVEGGSTLRIAGEWLSVSGLHFTDGYAPKGSVIEFRNGQELANHCRLTNCVIDKFNPSRRDQAYSYILLYGRHNRVDHCSLTGKLNLGVTLIVILNDERCLENHHRIDHNYFGERPVYGSNGAETMRVGTSQQAYSSSNTVIENNLFERCSGEVEVISIKSSDNIIRNNTLLECEGVVALRHGDRNTVNDNLFIGNGRRNTGGIRVVNAIRRGGHSGRSGQACRFCAAAAGPLRREAEPREPDPVRPRDALLCLPAGRCCGRQLLCLPAGDEESLCRDACRAGTGAELLGAAL